jgi:hypothetical protein
MSAKKIERTQPPDGYKPTCYLRHRYSGADSYVLEQLFESCYVGEEPQWRPVPYVRIEKKVTP